MQTQCPQCETQFRLTDAQLQAAGGLVRCGVCDAVFNALETLPDKIGLNSESHAGDKSPDDNITAAFDLADSKSEQDSTDDDSTSQETDADYDLFQHDDDTPGAQSVIPDELRDSRYTQPSPSLLSTLLWSLAILFLGLTLVLEYAWFHRDQLAQLPQVQPWIKRLCQHVDCKLAALRDPTQVELLSRNVYSHPNRKQALMVSVTLVNHASFAQPYPDMKIDFSDIRGAIVAARRFHASEYLNTQTPALLPPDQPVSFTLEIVDPGKQAMTYEFNFL